VVTESVFNSVAVNDFFLPNLKDDTQYRSY